MDHYEEAQKIISKAEGQGGPAGIESGLSLEDAAEFFSELARQAADRANELHHEAEAGG